MSFRFAHNNINVRDLAASIEFYGRALGLFEVRRIEPDDGSFIIVYLSDGESKHLLELTWLASHAGSPYDLGENEIHLAFTTPDFEAAHTLHREMDCICYENKKMGIYFISDPDGYWLEILPEKN